MVDYPEIAWFQKEKRKKKKKKKGYQEIANISEENRWIFFGGEDKGPLIWFCGFCLLYLFNNVRILFRILYI